MFKSEPQKHPWIPQREVAICPWETDKIRGDYTNPHASLLPNIYRYSRRQMAQYMRMLRQMGFTGVQFLDSCYSWNRYGSPEAFHDALIRMMTAAHEEGLQTSLWVWGAFFNGHGWCDPDVVYTPAPGNTSFADPKVRACFERYYDLYAELAPYTDRLIGHYFDPGCLTETADIIAYFKLLRDKFRLQNPNVRLAMDTWGSPDGYAEALANSDLRDCLLMEHPSAEYWPCERRVRFRETARKNGFPVGVWGWYTCEYETDQMSAMYVNAHVLQNRYLAVRAEADHVMSPAYWSEMDAGHLYNLFSLYCAGQFLMDPERDPDLLLREIVEMIWQGDSADAMYNALQLIERIRSGDRWETYWWTSPEFRWGTGDLQKDLADIEACFPAVERVAQDRAASSVRLALPFDPWVLAKLILPHLEQMRLLCVFQCNMRTLEEQLAAGASPDALYRGLDEILTPIPDFNTWVGDFMQIERREQYRIARDFCARAGIPVPFCASRFEELRCWALEKASVFQRGLAEPFLFDSSFVSEGYLAYPKEEAIRVMDSLYRDGHVLYQGNGRYILTRWQDYRFDFEVASHHSDFAG